MPFKYNGFPDYIGDMPFLFCFNQFIIEWESL